VVELSYHYKSQWWAFMPILLMLWAFSLTYDSNRSADFIFLWCVVVFGVAVYAYTGLKDAIVIDWTDNASEVVKEYYHDRKKEIDKHFLSRKTRDKNWNHSYETKVGVRYLTFRIDKEGRIDGVTSFKRREDFDEELEKMKHKRDEKLNEASKRVEELGVEFEERQQWIIDKYETPLEKELRINKENHRIRVDCVSGEDNKKINELDNEIDEFEEEWREING